MACIANSVTSTASSTSTPHKLPVEGVILSEAGSRRILLKAKKRPTVAHT